MLGHSARDGQALLQGLLLCGGCGHRLSPRDTGNGGLYPVYECTRRTQDTVRLPQCVHIQAPLIDQAVSRRVLEVFQPEQIQIALEAVGRSARSAPGGHRAAMAPAAGAAGVPGAISPAAL